MKPIIIILILMSVAMGYSLTVETASLSAFIYGTTDAVAYDNWISRVVEGLANPGLNIYAPWDRQTDGFGNFVNASSEQRTAWANLVNLFWNEEFAAASDIIDSNDFPYEIVQFHDTDTGRTYYMLREFLDMSYFDDNGLPDNPEIHQHGSFNYGWGLYVYNPASQNPVIVNVVHPKDDFIASPVAVKAFQMWDARYLMIAGAGREVLWQGHNYSNNVSLSDPSRNSNHVFNVAYQAFAYEIRTSFNRREFSAQIHSYDYTHPVMYRSLQISGGGSNYDYPGLPIRDLSDDRLDIINASPYVIFPANSIGIHSEVLVTDYYSVLYSDDGLYYNHEGSLLPISNHINLPGFVGNRQVQHTQNNWNKFDSFTPFFHIELRELPNVYPQDEYHYHWFYAYDFQNQRWDADRLYDKALLFYTPWLEAMAQVLPSVFETADDTRPTVPTDLRVTGAGSQTVSLNWERSSAYHFKTYEVLKAASPINLLEPNYQIIDREDISSLASQATNEITLSGLDTATQLYFRVRARSKNGHYSFVSNETKRYTGMVAIDEFEAFGRDGYIVVSWSINYQQNNEGFRLYRSISGTDDFIQIAELEYQEDSYIDETAINGVLYDYKLSAIDNENMEHFFGFLTSAAAGSIYTIRIENQNGLIYDTVEFGTNHFATDGYDPDFDIVKGSSPDEDYIRAMSYKSNWHFSLRNLQRDIYAAFDPDYELRSWVLRVRTDQLNEQLTLSISDNFPRNSEKLYLRDDSTGLFTDLTENPLTYAAANSNFRYFTLYWGNLLPVVEFSYLPNQFLQAGDNIEFAWQTTLPFMVNTIDVYLRSDTDSLLVVENLSYDTSSYQWTVPEGMFLLNARVTVITELFDGFRLKHFSPYRLGILPSSIESNYSAGWHLAANHFEYPPYTAEEFFGPGAVLFKYDGQQGSYQEDTVFEFGNGYFAHIPASYGTIMEGDVRKEQIDIPLEEGWNLIPNPFLHDFEIGDLCFVMNNAQYNLLHALRYNLVDRGFFCLQDNGYSLSETLPAAGSLWLFSYEPEVSLRLIPFRQNYYDYSYPYQWQITIMAHCEGWKDEIVVGSSYLTGDYYNFLYDLPKPPAAPGSGLYFYLTAQGTGHPFNNLHSYFKQVLNYDTVDSRYWDFSLHSDTIDQPIIISVEKLSLPDNYNIVLLLEEGPVTLSEDLDFILIPRDYITTGQFIVTNEELTIVEQLPEKPVLYSNYPNPFFGSSSGRRNSGTSIPFYLHEPARVRLDIYNIRGQKVRTLLDDMRERGRQKVFWDGKDERNRNMAAGIYIYRLSVNGSTVTANKMLLLK